MAASAPSRISGRTGRQSESARRPVAAPRQWQRLSRPGDQPAALQTLAVTAQVHNRIMGSPTTIAQQVKESRLPVAALNPAFRRIIRPRGPLLRKAVPASGGQPGDMLARMNAENGITAAPPKQAPE